MRDGWDMWLGHPYGVLPRCMQFIIFIHSGLFNGGGGKWHWGKIRRIYCFYGKHIYPPEFNVCKDGTKIKIQDFVRLRCIKCGFVKK